MLMAESIDHWLKAKPWQELLVSFPGGSIQCICNSSLAMINHGIQGSLTMVAGSQWVVFPELLVDHDQYWFMLACSLS